MIYQIYVRSFSDSDGDGIGDLEGVRARLGYLELLGVDALWLSPFYTSPMTDHGYDIADPRDVDPVFGDLAAFDRLVADAHAHGLKVTVDLVPNHISSQHEWFRAALDSPPGSPERARFHFRPGRGPNGTLPPNNWTSVFGGPAWTQVRGPGGGDWYLHIFTADQPDLNWTNLEVWADVEKTMRFWLDRGVDGFRIDVAHGMSKPDGTARRRGPGGPAAGGPPRRPPLRPRRRARRTPDDPGGDRPLPGPDRGRRGPGGRRRPVRPLPALRRAAPGVQLAAAARAVRRGRDPAGHREHAGRGGRGARVPRLGPEQPRHVPAGQPVRRRRGRAGARPGDDPGRAGPARRGAPLQRRGAGAARRRAARHRAAGPGVGGLGAHRTRPRRQPGADAVGGRAARLRIHRRHAVAADAARSTAR